MSEEFDGGQRFDRAHLRDHDVLVLLAQHYYGPHVGPLRSHEWCLVAGAAALCYLGLIATSRVQSLGLGYVTYGLGVGIAAACGYVPMVAVVGGWFEQHRAVAVGLAVAGIGVGTLVMSPVSAALIDRWGWRDTYVFFAVGGAGVMLACVPLVGRPTSRRRLAAAVSVRGCVGERRVPPRCAVCVRPRPRVVRAVRFRRSVRQGARHGLGASSGARRRPGWLERALPGGLRVAGPASRVVSSLPLPASSSRRGASCSGSPPGRRTPCWCCSRSRWAWGTAGSSRSARSSSRTGWASPDWDRSSGCCTRRRAIGALSRGADCRVADRRHRRLSLVDHLVHRRRIRRRRAPHRAPRRQIWSSRTRLERPRLTAPRRNARPSQLDLIDWSGATK